MQSHLRRAAPYRPPPYITLRPLLLIVVIICAESMTNAVDPGCDCVQPCEEIQYQPFISQTALKTTRLKEMINGRSTKSSRLWEEQKESGMGWKKHYYTIKCKLLVRKKRKVTICYKFREGTMTFPVFL